VSIFSSVLTECVNEQSLGRGAYVKGLCVCMCVCVCVCMGGVGCRFCLFACLVWCILCPFAYLGKLGCVFLNCAVIREKSEAEHKKPSKMKQRGF